MNNIIFVTGAPASGKSTIAPQIAEHFPESIHIQVDQLLELMLKSIKMSDHDWTDEASRQFQRARPTAIYMAKLYTSGEEVLNCIGALTDTFASTSHANEAEL